MRSKQLVQPSHGFPCFSCQVVREAGLVKAWSEASVIVNLIFVAS